ncbi:MAG: glycosyltransferase family 61 protein [Halioglobus sp.]|nr:glycosyltransferase family 61 protein [Halioglobus sp.]
MGFQNQSSASASLRTDSITGFYTLDEKLQRVRGWVFNPSEPKRSQWVEICANQHVICVLYANLHRADLSKLKTGYTQYGFEFLFSSETAPVNGVDIQVRHQASGSYLRSKAKAFQIRPVHSSSIPIRSLDQIQTEELVRHSDRVAIDSRHWCGDREFIDQLIGFNSKTAQRVGKMYRQDDGDWAYTKTVRYIHLRDTLVVMPYGCVIADNCLIRSNLGFPHPMRVRPIISRDDEVTEQSHEDWLQTATKVRLRIVDNAVRRVDGPALLMSAPKYQGYNHWHADVLPMLAAVPQLIPTQLKCVISPGCPTHWHESSLQIARSTYPKLHVVEASALSVLSVKDLIYTTGLGGNGCYLAPALVEFYERLGNSVKDKNRTPGTGKKLYLSRRNYPRRLLSNEAEIEQTARSMGFQVIDPAAYCYEDQIRIFRHAEFVVAPHGAALTNLFFSPSGVKVIELFADCYTNRALQRLANLKKARYGYIVGESLLRQGSPGAHAFSYHIDAASLIRLIEAMDDV